MPYNGSSAAGRGKTHGEETTYAHLRHRHHRLGIHGADARAGDSHAAAVLRGRGLPRRDPLHLHAARGRGAGRRRRTWARTGRATTANCSERDDIDVVSVCTPNAQHEQMALDALAAKKHLYIDKPLAVTGEEARRVAAAAREAECLYQGGLQPAPLSRHHAPKGAGGRRRAGRDHAVLGPLPALRLHRSRPPHGLETGSGGRRAARPRLPRARPAYLDRRLPAGGHVRLPHALSLPPHARGRRGDALVRRSRADDAAPARRGAGHGGGQQDRHRRAGRIDAGGARHARRGHF